MAKRTMRRTRKRSKQRVRRYSKISKKRVHKSKHARKKLSGRKTQRQNGGMLACCGGNPQQHPRPRNTRPSSPPKTHQGPGRAKRIHVKQPATQDLCRSCGDYKYRSGCTDLRCRSLDDFQPSGADDQPGQGLGEAAAAAFRRTKKGSGPDPKTGVDWRRL